MPRILIALLAALALAAAPAQAHDGRDRHGGQHGHGQKPKPPGTVDLQVLGLNDLHGNLEPTKVSGQDAGGVAWLGSYLAAAKAQNPNGTIVAHAGDTVGASPLISSWFHDEPTIQATNLMGVDVGTVGNHEFDEGGTEMLRLIRGGHRDDGKQFKDGVDTSDPNFPGADYPYVSANVTYADSGRYVLPPFTIVKRRGIPVGVIGVTTTETPSIVVPDAVAPFEFSDVSDAVNKQVKILHRLGVHTIVVLAHAGGFMTPAPPSGEIIDETRQMDPDVDLVVAGHTHSLLNTRVNNALVVQAFRYGTAFDKVTLTVDRRTRDVTASTADVITTYHNPEVTPLPDIAQMVQTFKDRIAPVSSRVVGTAASDVATAATGAGESPIGDLIADGQAHETGAQLALMNPGGIRSNIQAGQVTFGDLFAVQPFDNGLVKMTLTGTQVKDVLEQQFRPDPKDDKILQVAGLRETYDRTRADGDRITALTLADGTPIDPAASYTVAANSFLATGGDGFMVFKLGSGVTSFGTDVDALEHYVESLPQPFSAPDPAAAPRIVKAG